MYDNLSRVIEVDIDEILPNRFQPRIQFDEEEILELSDSIKEHGVIQPLVVRTIGDKYEIIAGERRYKASVLAGKETVPVIVKNLNDKDSAEIALIENIQRRNLTPIEEALSYKKILDMGYITQENLAAKLGKSQPAVANKIRLLNLSDEVQEALLENKISERHARSLLKLPISKQQNEMLNRIITERLTVRKADEEIEKIKNNSSDESNDDTQKKIEKGEIEMNNNMFGMPSVPQNPQPSFDIFGGSIPVEQPVVSPGPNPVSEFQQIPSFDIFGGSTSEEQPTESNQPMFNVHPQSVVTVEPEVPAVPVMPEAPTNPTMGPMSIPMFNIEPQPVVTVEPEVPAVPVMPEAPTNPTTGPMSIPMFNIEPQPAVAVEPEVPAVSVMPEAPINPTMGPMSIPMFNIEPQPVVAVEPEVPAVSVMPEAPTNPTTGPMSIPMFNIEPQPVVAVEPEVPAVPVVPEVPTIEVPQTAPIIESPVAPNNQIAQQSDNLFSFGEANLNTPEPVQPEVPRVPEFKMPEPIIITDYSKQYDPVMPVSPETMKPIVDFKEVIGAIRECSSKIEKYGFRIDVEEYDLANLYQVIFKIEK